MTVKSTCVHNTELFRRVIGMMARHWMQLTDMQLSVETTKNS